MTLTEVLDPFPLVDVTGMVRLSVDGIVGLTTVEGVTPVTMVMFEGRIIGGPTNKEI